MSEEFKTGVETGTILRQGRCEKSRESSVNRTDRKRRAPRYGHTTRFLARTVCVPTGPHRPGGQSR
jgi:hypothetical protein